MSNIKFTDGLLNDSKTISTDNCTDSEAPYTFGDWMKYSNSLSMSYDEYKKYISNWSSVTAISNNNTDVRDQYVTYLKQLTLNHLFTDDEVRYLNTVDLSNRLEAESAACIYARKLKQTCNYIQQQRVETKHSNKKHQQLSTVGGVGSVIYNDILRLLRDKDFQTKYKLTLEELDRMSQELRVELVELYDVEDGYTGSSGIDTESESYKLSQSLNNIDYDPHIFFNESTALANIISRYDILSDIEIEEFRLGIKFDPTQVDLAEYLPPYEFTNYEPGIENLNIAPMKDLIQKSAGADTYYIKTTSTASIAEAGLLFTSTDRTGNIYNKQQPHINLVSNDDTNTKTIYELGGFFTPDRLGVITYTSLEPSITIDSDKLEPDTIYTYPDAKSLGDTPRNSITPLKYTESSSWMKRETVNEQVSDILDRSNYQKFYNYISTDEYNKYSTLGISRKDDPFDFWSSDVGDVWANEDVYATEETLDLPIESRQEDQLVNNGQPYNWRVDIYGNEYALLKNMISYDEEGFDVDECDKDKYQDGLLCRIFDGSSFTDMLRGLPTFTCCVDGGSNINVSDISTNIDLLSAANMMCNDSTCPVGTRWKELDGTGSISLPGLINGFSSPPVFLDLANASYFLPILCIDDEEEAATVYNCNIIDGYTIKVPQGYEEVDVYELTASHYGVNEEPTFSAQSGAVFNPPFDNAWDCGDFDVRCTDIPLEEFYDIEETVKYMDSSIESVPSSLEESNQTPPLDTQQSRLRAPGSLIIRNNNSKYIDAHHVVLDDIIQSLPEEYKMIHSDDNGLTEYYKTYNPRDEIKNDLIDVDVIIDILILRTTNFVYVLKISYDYDTGSISIDKTYTLLIGLDYRSVYVRHFYCEKEDTILIGSYQSPVSTSPANPVPTFKPSSIYTIPVSNTTLKFSRIAFPTTGYLLPTNVTSFDPGDCIVSYNEQLKLYYITCVGRLNDNVYGDRFFTYQSRFAPTSKNSPNLIAFDHKLYYTTALDFNQTETLNELFGVETLSQDDRGFSYYNLADMLNDSNKSSVLTYSDIDTRLHQLNADDFATGTPEEPLRVGDFSALFVPEAVNTFYFKLHIDPNNILESLTSPIYRIEARFHRPDIASDHIDRVYIDRNPMPNFSSIDITRIPDGNDLADPRQSSMTYEYNFKRSPDKCINNDPGCMTAWDFGTHHAGELYKFVIIAHTADGQKHIYPYKFILKPYDAGTSLTGITLTSATSYVDRDYNECTLLVLESSTPKMTVPVVLRTRSLVKERYNQDELLSFSEYVVPNTQNSLNLTAYTSQI